jgi:hypothetical protein
MVSDQSELDPAALPDAQPLPNLLRDGDLPLAGDGRRFHVIFKPRITG